MQSEGDIDAECDRDEISSENENTQTEVSHPSSSQETVRPEIIAQVDNHDIDTDSQQEDGNTDSNLQLCSSDKQKENTENNCSSASDVITTASISKEGMK